MTKRWTMIGSSLALATLLLAGCGGSKSTPAAGAGATPVSTASSAIGTGSPSAATSGLASPRATGTTTGTSVAPIATPPILRASPVGTPSAYAEAQLNPALLTPQELPGWNLSTSNPNLPLPGNPCNSSLQIDEAAQVNTGLDKGSNGPFFSEAIDSFTGNGAASAISQIKGALSCPQWTETGPEEEQITWKVAPLSIPSLGQASVAVRLTTDAPTASMLDIVYIQEGSVLIGVAQLAGSNLDQAVTQQLAQQADQKVKQVLHP